MADASGDDKKTVSEKCSAGFASFRHFMYHEEPVEGDVPNKTQGLVMGRTGSSWGECIFKTCIYYAISVTVKVLVEN